MLRSRQVQEPHKGCFGRCALRCMGGRSKARIDWDSEAPADLASNRQTPRSVWEETWRSPGQGHRWSTLEGQNPREAPVVVGLNPRLVTRHFREARTQKPRLIGAGRRLRSSKCRWANGMRVRPGRKGRGNLPEGETFEGWIPGAPPVRKKTGTGLEGVRRQEGNQTLKTERSGRWVPASSGPRVPDVL